LRTGTAEIFAATEAEAATGLDPAAQTNDVGVIVVIAFDASINDAVDRHIGLRESCARERAEYC